MKLRAKLNTVLKALELGMEIEITTGHKIVWSEEHDAPGFLVSRHYLDKEPVDAILQIDSDTAWSFLLGHVREMTDEKVISLVSDVALNELKRKQ